MSFTPEWEKKGGTEADTEKPVFKSFFHGRMFQPWFLHLTSKEHVDFSTYEEHVVLTCRTLGSKLAAPASDLTLWILLNPKPSRERCVFPDCGSQIILEGMWGSLVVSR